MVPGYALRGILGAGGMGTVFLADSEQHGAVALKVLFGADTDSGLARRFRREAEGLSSLRLPGVVEVYDSGFDGDVHWLAMQWIQGPTLERVLGTSGRLPEAEALRIAIAVARTLGQVHEAGMVHRDIKPSNLLLNTDGTPVLADFGILRHLDDDSYTALTHRPIGTPAYMAPEIMKSGDIDWVRSDVYALAVMLARCLLGRVPQGDWDLEEISPRIRPVISRAMSSRADLRYATADAFADALESPPAPVGNPLRAGLIVAMVCGIALLAVGVFIGRAPGGAEARMDFSPVAELLRSDRHEEAERVFALQLDQADRATADALWLEWASALGQPEVWGEAWDQVSEDAREDALRGLASALLAAEDFGALDTLLAQGNREALDPTGAISSEVDLFQARFTAARERAPEGFRPLIDRLSQAIPVTQGSLPIAKGWWCMDEGCVPKADLPDPGTIFSVVHGTREEYVWGEGWIEPLGGGERCALPELGPQHSSAAWNGHAVLVTTGEFPMVYLVDPSTCTLRKHPDHEAWENSFITIVAPWDADGDGVEELAVMVGEPFGYEVRLYDTEDLLIDSVLVGSIRSWTLMDGDLVVCVGEPHANGGLVALQERGAHRIRLQGGELRVVDSWPGGWGHVTAGDLLGDGRDVLGLLEYDVQAAFAIPGVEDLMRVGPIHFMQAIDVDGNGVDELGVKTNEGLLLLGAAGVGSFAVPRPTAYVLTGDAEIDRARALEGVGMGSLAARRLSLHALARTGDSAREAWAEAGRMHEEVAEQDAAIKAWTEAAYRGHPGAWDQAVGLSLRNGDLTEAARLLESLPPGEEVAERWRDAVGSLWVHDFRSRPKEWALRSPFAVWDADRSVLRFQSAGASGVIAEIPLEARGPVRGFEVDLELDRLEFASDLRFRLVGEHGVVSELRVFSGGSRGGLFRSVSPGPFLLLPVEDADPMGPHRLTVTLAMDGSEGVFSVAEGGELVRREFKAGEAGPVVALRIEAVGAPGALADISIHHVALWGMALGKRRSLPDATPTTERSLALTTLRIRPVVSPARADDLEMLELMEDAYVVSWRMHRGASRLQDRLLGIPGLDDPAVWRASPELALVRAEIYMSQGDAEGALEILRNIELPDECVRRNALIWAAELTRERSDGVEDARKALDACRASETRVRTELWWLGLEG